MKDSVQISKLSGLEVVRAMAALTVVAGHIVYYEFVAVPTWIKMLSAFATEAVIIFFVLSGLVISRSVQRNTPGAIRFLSQRLVRIYPIYFFSIVLAIIASFVFFSKNESVSVTIGNLLFLQDLGGYIVPPLATNQPLWSLSYELAYYAIFALTIWQTSIIRIFWVAAILGALAVSLKMPTGVYGHFAGIFSLALPWLFGNWIARNVERCHNVSVALGVCLLIIGLTFARSPFTENFYDPFRLCAFGLLSSPLILALARPADQIERVDLPIRPIAFAIGASLLWEISPALFVTKFTLTMAAAVAAFVPLKLVETILLRISFFKQAFVYVGSISYAIYAIHVPILFLLKPITPDIAIVRLTLYFSTVFLISHLLERCLQPAIASRFSFIGENDHVENHKPKEA